MIKKTLVGFVLLALLGTFVFGRDAVSYLRTGCKNVRNAVKSEVPLEFEIARAQTLVDQLVPDIRQCLRQIAEQQVDVEYRQAALTQKETGLAKQKEVILSMRSDLASGKTAFTYASHTYSGNEVSRDLATRFERYKAVEEILASDRSILQSRRQILAANSEKLSGMLKAKQDLEVQLEQLQARVQTMRATESASTLSIDDSNLNRARTLITDLNKQLDVKQ
ncbi:MAG: signal peptide-containing protein, partial [Planctomycetaceae bacterium]|nr:signal peptide-containing protein [Planctomycetaceae bacterium]